MPVGYHISPDEGLITVQGDGNVALSEITRVGRSLLGDAAYDPELPQLLDFRGLRPLAKGELGELRAFVHGPYRNRVTANVAVVIDAHLERRHCADIFLLTCAIDQAELFADYDLALRWLMRRAFALQPEPSAEQQDSGRDHADSTPE
jgi:hypothetical protein